MCKYRNKPVVIEAWQMPLTASELLEINQKTNRIVHADDRTGKQEIICETLEGEMKGTNDDWIILGVENEVYPCKDSVFKATYEKVEEGI